MRYLISIAAAALLTSGCVKTQAVTRGARRMQRKVTPAARAFADGSRRLVQFAGQEADDAALAARVKATLMLRNGLGRSDVQVQVEEGVVCLSGHVSSAAQRQIAGEAARGTVGVTSIKNRLKVVGHS